MVTVVQNMIANIRKGLGDRLQQAAWTPAAAAQVAANMDRVRQELESKERAELAYAREQLECIKVRARERG